MGKTIQTLRYLGYLLQHKWYVFIECLKLGLVYRGLTHDLSKFRACEFWAYRNWFYGGDQGPKAKAEFEAAHQAHLDRNDHHWQRWRGKEIPLPARKELLADWRAMARFNHRPAYAWYREHGHELGLGPETKAWLEARLEAGSAPHTLSLVGTAK